MYRQTTTIAPKANDVISGQPGTIISGARLLTTWTPQGLTWTNDGNLPAPYTDTGYNPCQDTTTNLCKLDEWLFTDNVPVRRVASAALVVPGTFYTDYAANRIYVGDDPSGHTVELSRTRTAITSSGAGVTLTGLLVEKFATANQRGAIVANAADWTISNSQIRFNHGAGVYAYGINLHVLSSRVDHNGTTGIAVYRGNGALVQDSELDHNNTDGSLINDGENGGYKSTNTLNDVLRNNNVHDNLGMGLWFDIDDNGSLIEGNTLAGNASDGVRFEISYNGIIRNNTVTGNGLNRQQGDGGLYYGAGIVVSNGNTVDVYGNILVGNDNSLGAVMQNRGSGIYGTWQLIAATFHDNTVTQRQGLTGIQQGVGDPSYFTTKGNGFTANHYTLDSLTAPRFAWQNTTGGVAFWQGWGQDTTGTFVVG